MIPCVCISHWHTDHCLLNTTWSGFYQLNKRNMASKHKICMYGFKECKNVLRSEWVRKQSLWSVITQKAHVALIELKRWIILPVWFWGFRMTLHVCDDIIFSLFITNPPKSHSKTTASSHRVMDAQCRWEKDRIRYKSKEGKWRNGNERSWLTELYVTILAGLLQWRLMTSNRCLIPHHSPQCERSKQ